MNFIANGSQEDLKIPCQDCDLMFLTEPLRQSHAERQHQAPRLIVSQSSKERGPTYCNLCYCEFRYPSLLRDHQKIHSSAVERSTFCLEEINPLSLTLSCAHCDLMFIHVNALRYHNQHTHKDEPKPEEIACEYCNKVFKWKNKGNLKKHIQTIHNVLGYNLDAYYYGKKPDAGESVTNFMNLLNSLG